MVSTRRWRSQKGVAAGGAQSAGNPRGIRGPLHRVDRQGRRPLADERYAGLRRDEARLRAEGEVLRGMESPRRVGQLRDLASVFDVALAAEPAEIAGAQTQGEQAINFNREIPRLTTRVRRVIESLRQLLQRSLNPRSKLRRFKIDRQLRFASYHSSNTASLPIARPAAANRRL